MAKSKQYNKKPGIKDIVKVVQALVKEQSILYDKISEIIGLFDLYLEYKGDGDNFMQYVEEKVNENQANESIDGADTDGDKQNKEQRPEGVRS